MQSDDACRGAGSASTRPTQAGTRGHLLPILALALFAAFVLFGALGGWNWFLQLGDRGPGPGDRVAYLA